MCQIWQQDELSCTALSQENCIFSWHYSKLVETFHVASECNTAVYFSWSLIQAFAQPVQLFWLLVTFRVASCNSLTDSDLQLFIKTEQFKTKFSLFRDKIPHRIAPRKEFKKTMIFSLVWSLHLFFCLSKLIDCHYSNVLRGFVHCWNQLESIL